MQTPASEHETSPGSLANHRARSLSQSTTTAPVLNRADVTAKVIEAIRSSAPSKVCRGASTFFLPVPLDGRTAPRRRPLCDIDGWLYLGFHPALYRGTIDPSSRHAAYVTAYLQRDVRQIIWIG